MIADPDPNGPIGPIGPVERTESPQNSGRARETPEPDPPPPPDPLGHLLPQHRKLIEDSAILPDVAKERGYRSVVVRAELRRMGFSDLQARVPALFLPVHGVTGEIIACQIRPDQPRMKEGKLVKYETPPKTKMVLDVPPQCRAALADRSVPLLFTEGIRKGDSAASKGLCCVSLLGVWNWRHTNDSGGKTAIPEFELLALNGRTVYICFDSDVMTKRQVRQALVRLKRLLELWDAHVLIVYLPPGPGGRKVGLDDFFGAGGTVQELLSHASEELRAPEGEVDDGQAGPYRIRDGCTWWEKPGQDGSVPVQLANFTAEIRAELALDDGMEIRREFEIEATAGERTFVFAVAARAFPAQNWVSEHLGARGIVAPGFGLRDHLRVAILEASKDAEAKTIYTHTGWREIESVGDVYLHAGGAIGADGAVPGIEVRLPENFQGMTIPTPPEGEELKTCLKATLSLLLLGPLWVMCALLGACFRVVLGRIDASVFLHGASDSFKTEIAALFQSFFGTGFGARNLPGSWLSTANSLEMLAFLGKDMVITVDDFVPSGSRQDVQRMHREVERILRAQGNRAGRDRLGPDAVLRGGRPPRGMILGTGEDLPARHSALARAMVIELAPGDVTSQKLSEAQQHAADGRFASTMAAFLCWLAPRRAEVARTLATRVKQHRKRAQADDRHRRTATVMADLESALEILLAFMRSSGAITEAEAVEWSERCWKALTEAAEAQASHHEAAEPASLFLQLLSSAVASGEAHIASTSGGAPANCGALGWRENGTEEVEGQSLPIYRPLGSRVGWTDGENLYLDLNASRKAAQGMASESQSLSVSGTTLAKRLKTKGFLLSTEDGRLLVRRVLGEKRARVLHLSIDVLLGAGQSGQSGHGPSGDAEEAVFEEESWTSLPDEPVQTGPGNWATPDQPRDGAPEPGPNGPVGPESSGNPRPSETRARDASASQETLFGDEGGQWDD